MFPTQRTTDTVRQAHEMINERGSQDMPATNAVHTNRPSA